MRLQFDVSSNELWKHWCELQTPIADEVNAGLYSCVHNWGGGGGPDGCWQIDPTTQMNVTVDCGKLSLCSYGVGVCSCTAQACVAKLDGDVHFDMMLASPKADGSITGLDAGVHNVHLSKQ
jgi:hypothetical protein